jgi:hypothetical protein
LRISKIFRISSKKGKGSGHASSKFRLLSDEEMQKLPIKKAIHKMA